MGTVGAWFGSPKEAPFCQELSAQQMGWDPRAVGLTEGLVEGARPHLGLGEVPDFVPAGSAQPAEARGLLDAVVEGRGAGGAAAHRLQVLAGEGLQSTWKTRREGHQPCPSAPTAAWLPGPPRTLPPTHLGRG